jgi:hypothetical protein
MRRFTIYIFLCLTFFVRAEKIEFTDDKGEVFMLFNRSGMRTDISGFGLEMNCPDRPGNRTYMSKDQAIFRASRKINHISIYKQPEGTFILRIGIDLKSYKFTDANGNEIAQLRKNALGADLEIANKPIASANFNALSSNTKCTSAQNDKAFVYKARPVTFGGLAYYLPNIDNDLKLVIIHELLTAQ